MFINMLIIGEWLLVIGIFGLGYYVRDHIKEKKETKENSWLAD